MLLCLLASEGLPAGGRARLRLGLGRPVSLLPQYPLTFLAAHGRDLPAPAGGKRLELLDRPTLTSAGRRRSAYYCASEGPYLKWKEWHG